MFGFGCGHVKYDEAIHDAKWGARLIYAEVTDGYSGVVWDRQTPDGEKELVESLFPVVDRAMAEFRKPENMYTLTSDSRGRLCWREGPRLVVMSPQSSYGYLYITAVLEKPGHEGETHIADFNIEDGSKFPQLGNWPPEVVEAARVKRRKSLEGQLEYAEREYKWALDKVRWAKTPRATTIRQKKADEIAQQIDNLKGELVYE